VECAPRETPIDKLWVRSVEYSDYATVDPRLFDLGRFSIATIGMQAASTIGELWVSYDVEFFKPQLNLEAEEDAGLTWLHVVAPLAAGINSYIPPSATSDPSSTLTASLSDGFLGGYQTLGFPTIPIGRYEVTTHWQTTTSASSISGAPALTGATFVAGVLTGVATSKNSGSGTNYAVQTFFMETTQATGVRINWPSTATVVGTGTWDLFIARIPSTAELKGGCGETKASKVIRALEAKLRAATLSHPLVLPEKEGKALEGDVDHGPLAMTASGRLCTHVDETWTDVGVKGNTLDCHMRRLEPQCRAN